MLARIACLVVAFPLLVTPAVAMESESLFDRVTRQAQALSKKPYSEPEGTPIPKALADLDYPAYQAIHFKESQALWRDQALFDVEFFHLGYLYKKPVVIHEVRDGQVRTIQYHTGLFDFGKNKGLTKALGEGLDFAGFRVNFPLNTPNTQDEVVAFLGASYFRMVGRGQRYGLSARGLAIDTGLPKGEEFPYFREFWLVRPGPEATHMTFYALLDSQSLTGAYRFELHPGQHVVMDVQARLFARADVQRLGIAPLTSMFMWGENRIRHFDDYRPEVHDSDGLLLHTGAGEWIWRPLTNPHELQVSSLLDKDPRGFGLIQRDREFEHYLDSSARYDSRPSLWVAPRGDGWGKGAVQLIELPSQHRSNDNIVAFWVPDRQLKAGQARAFRYRLATFGAGRTPDSLASVKRTRIGQGILSGNEGEASRSLRQFVVDFAGGPLTGLAPSQPVKAHLTARAGKTRDITVERLPEEQGWRVAFQLNPQDGSKPVDLRLYLTMRGKRLSETWNYVWDPEAIQ